MNKHEQAVAEKLADKIQVLLNDPKLTEDSPDIVFDALAMVMRVCAETCGPSTGAKAFDIADNISDLIQWT
jgi:hypothetical protein